MANIKIAGRAATIVSIFTTEQLELVRKYRPDALVLKDEDGNVTFKVTTACEESISQYGVAFAADTFGDGKACLTVVDNCGYYDKPEEFVIDAFGKALLNLNKVERQIPDALDEIEAELDLIKDAIEIA